MNGEPRQPAVERKPLHLGAFLVSFFALWTLRILLWGAIDAHSTSLFAHRAWSEGFRIVLWLFFPIGWLWIDTGSIGEALKLPRPFSRHWATILITEFVCCAQIVHIATTGERHEMSERLWDYVVAANAALLIGSVEEFVFRGIVMGELWRRHGFWIANLASALLFVLIHWPGWIMLGHLPPISLMTISVNIFVFGLVMGVVAGLEGNIRLAIVLHALNDFLIGAVFR